ncbi:hypothetical protein HID58_011890 [Brassica napus]|uniref:Uncharacterized protein n=1 Tax=Brassica napus TaxID=3708 RepID=A0ABQ8DZZ9_BRANA|nr:hypothetical protein HID58_011890 [Brassica napus]
MVSEPYGSRTIAAMEAPSFNYKPKARKSKTLLKYSCEEIEERMSNGLCIFCEERDTPGHHDLKHKGVKILMIESDDQPVVTESDHKPMVEESLADSDELVIETVMKPDSFSESLEGLTSDLQVVYAADPKEAQNKSVAEENMSFSLGNNIEHMVGKKSQVADHVWEPGGLIAKPTSWNCLDKYLPTRNLLRNGLEMFIQSAETKSVNERKSFKSRRVWERGGLKATFALAILTPPFDISFDDMVIQEMRKSCGLTVVGSASISMMRWLHMIELVCSVMIKLDEKSSLKNLEKFRSLEKAASDVNSLLNVPEPVMPCSRPQLVLGLRQLTLADIKFHLKHKWRSRLLESFSCLEITTDHIVLFPSCCMNAYSVREQETKSGYPVYQENHAHCSCETMLKQCFLQILSQQNKQETRKLSFSDSATTDSGHPLLNNFKSVLAHSNKELSQVRVQHDQKLSLATRMFKCSPSICGGEINTVTVWKWYPPEQTCQACSGWFLRLWTWQKRVRFFSSRWLIFGERVTSPSCIQGQRCTKLTQPHVDIVICISKEMTPVTNTWSFDDSFLVTEKHKYNGNGATLKLSYLIRGYGDRDIMKLQIICIYIMSLLLFYGSLPRPPEFRKIKKKLKGLKLELRDEILTSLFAGTRNEDVSSCGTTGQAREEVVSSHVEVRRTIAMFQSKAWIFKYNDKRQERDRNETQQQALKIKLEQSRYCREFVSVKYFIHKDHQRCKASLFLTT